MSPRSHHERIDDILTAITKIRIAEELLETNSEEYPDVAFDSILYNLVVIGEAVKNLDTSYKNQKGEIPWQEISGLRDLIAHQYFRIEIAMIRIYIDNPLANLEAALRLNV